jgi:hypothetical protein
MALERWEIQLLVLLAKNRESSSARDIFEQYKPRLSEQAKSIAEGIISGKGHGRFAETAAVFLDRAAAHNAQREIRESLHAHG